MAKEPCDGCGRAIAIGGGIANIWTLDTTPTEGMTIELADGTEHFLCYDCMDQLPDDREVTEDDVENLS